MDARPRPVNEPSTVFRGRFRGLSITGARRPRPGAYRDCQPLRGQSATTTVRVRGGETLITDGPAAEIKEQLGGYAIVECDDLDEALRWAARSPAARDASVEVHPVVTVEAPM